ncbi:MAG: hypothetical protein ACI9HB_003471, partial [Gammaproteobacteria bacterium]
VRLISPKDHDRTRHNGVDDHGFWIMCAFGINGDEGFPAGSSLQKDIPRSGQYANRP